MNTVYIIAKSFVLCSFSVLFIRIIAPKGNTEKIVSFVLVVFTLFSVIAPIKNIRKITLPNFESYSEQPEITKQNKCSVIKTEIRILTDEALNSINIDDYELIVDVSEDEDGTVLIDEYKIYIRDISRKEETINAVKAKTELSPEVYEMDITE